METSSWNIVSIAKLQILDRLDMLKLLFLNPLQQFPYISLRLNCWHVPKVLSVECDGCREGDGEKHTSKTKNTDVYAFGSL